MKAFAITLLGNLHAQKLLTDCINSGLLHDWSIQPWPAVNGWQISPNYFARLNLQLNPNTKIFRRPGAQGCFLSHWALWNYCREINESIVVLESDAVIQAPLPAFTAADGILKLHKDRGTKTGTSGTWSKGAHAYIIAPEHADQLITGILRTEVRPADKAIGTAFVPWQHSDSNIVALNSRRGPSTTSPQLNT
jgi:hypothetical protein